MKLRPIFHALVVLCCLRMIVSGENAVAQELAQTTLGSTFSYQGQLRSSGNPLTGACDFQFKLFDAATRGNQVGTVRTLSKLAVQNGLFNVELDFGKNAFSEGARWLEVAVAYPAGSGSFTVLSPRHKLTPAPLALFAAAVAKGAVTSATIASGAVTSDKIRSVEWSKIAGAPAALAPTGKASGDLTGTYPAPLITPGAVTPDKLANGAVTSRSLAAGAVTDEKILNVDWSKISGAPQALAPTGLAGGVLAGSYPNPLLASLAVTSATLADNSITSRTIVDNSITSRTIVDNSITSRTIAAGAVLDEKIVSLSWSKITGAPTTLPPTGAAAGDLAGAYPAPAIAPGVVTSDKLADGAVCDAKITDVGWGKITGAPSTLPPSGAAGGVLAGAYPKPALANQAVTSTALAADAVTSYALAAGAVTDDKITSVAWGKITGVPAALPPSGAAGGALAGTYPKPTLAGQAVTNTALADGAVTTAKLAADAVTNRTLAAGAVTDEKISSVAWGKVTGRPSALPPSGDASGDLAGAYPAPAIASGAVSTDKLASGAVTADKLASGAVTNSKIASVAWGKVTGAPAALPPAGDAGGALKGTYPSPSLADGSVSTATIVKGAVTSATLAARAVTPEKLAVPMRVTGTTLGAEDSILEVYNDGAGRALDAVTYSSRLGVRGQIYGLNGWGLYGISHSGAMGTGVGGESSEGYGVTGRNMSSSNYGHLGSPTEGVYGESMSDNGHGVAGVCDTGAAIYGESKGPGLAGMFVGDVKVSGTLTAFSKDFQIDHPLDPSHKLLNHAAVEGPERMNLYCGNVVTDAAGNAEVVLPAYFESLNTDFRYQLTVIGKFAQAIIAREIKDNRFTIRTNKPGVKVSWQVIGIRQDAYAKAHPFVVEEDKKTADGE